MATSIPCQSLARYQMSARYLLPLPWKVWTWGEISPGLTIGSMRARPVEERHGIRQNADALPAKASARAAACDLIVMLSMQYEYDNVAVRPAAPAL